MRKEELELYIIRTNERRASLSKCRRLSRQLAGTSAAWASLNKRPREFECECETTASKLSPRTAKLTAQATRFESKPHCTKNANSNNKNNSNNNDNT